MLGYFNMTPEKMNLKHFAYVFNQENLIYKATRFKWLPSCIVLIIRNRKSYFKNTCLTAIGISSFHKLTAVSLKSQVLKVPPKIKFYRIYKNLTEDHFNKDLKLKLGSLK